MRGVSLSPGRSAVNQGYLDDRYVSVFVPRGRRRSPVINRGYFARAAGVEEVVFKFMALCAGSTQGTPQIISLGAGLDTTFFKLRVRVQLPLAP
jgi:tRNA wybutosine-synthesizing protein 4